MFETSRCYSLLVWNSKRCPLTNTPDSTFFSEWKRDGIFSCSSELSAFSRKDVMSGTKPSSTSRYSRDSLPYSSGLNTTVLTPRFCLQQMVSRLLGGHGNMGTLYWLLHWQSNSVTVVSLYLIAVSMRERHKHEESLNLSHKNLE